MYEYGFRWYDPALARFTSADPIADQFPRVSVYNYAENDPIGHIDLHGFQKYKPNMERYDSPSELFSKKTLTNIKEGSKLAATEFGEALNTLGGKLQDGLKSLASMLPGQGDPSAEDFHDMDRAGDSDDTIPEGVTVLSNSGLNAEGTLDTEDGTSSVILEESDLTATAPDAGGAEGDFAGGNTVARRIYYMALAVKQAKAAQEEVPDRTEVTETKVDTTYKLGDYTITRYTPNNE